MLLTSSLVCAEASFLILHGGRDRFFIADIDLISIRFFSIKFLTFEYKVSSLFYK